MTEQLYPNIYRLRIPLPKNPLKELNCYVIAGKERSLIIDTGFNRPECEEALLGGIAELGIALDRTDVLLTHRHSDHTGLARLLEERGARVFAGRAEQENESSIEVPPSPATCAETLYVCCEVIVLSG